MGGSRKNITRERDCTQLNGSDPPLQNHDIELVCNGDRVPVLQSGTAHAALQEAGASSSHAAYRLKRACLQGTVRYKQLDAVRRLYAAEDVHALAETIRQE